MEDASTLAGKFIARGLNPQVALYNPKYQNRPKYVELLPKLLEGQSLNTNFYFGLRDSICSTCPESCCDKIDQFRIGKNNGGIRIGMTENTKIGKGGFATVYKGVLHGRPIASKTIDQSYK